LWVFGSNPPPPPPPPTTPFSRLSTTEQRTRMERGYLFLQAWEYYEMSELGSPPPLLPATLGAGERMRSDYIQGSMSELDTYRIGGFNERVRNFGRRAQKGSYKNLCGRKNWRPNFLKICQKKGPKRGRTFLKMIIHINQPKISVEKYTLSPDIYHFSLSEGNSV
jgi:hypothetical protein